MAEYFIRWLLVNRGYVEDQAEDMLSRIFRKGQVRVSVTELQTIPLAYFHAGIQGESSYTHKYQSLPMGSTSDVRLQEIEKMLSELEELS